MHARQKGITFIGWLILLVPVAIVGYAGIRLAPMYLNYMKVAKAMKQIAAEHAGDEPDQSDGDTRGPRSITSISTASPTRRQTPWKWSATATSG